jgi:hypothetical protein
MHSSIMTTETTGSPAPAEVLIPEARQHQKQRYRRRGVAVVIAALVAAALVLSSLLLLHGPAAGGKTQPDPKPAGAAAASAHVYFRPVLCFAVAYAPAAGAGADGVPSGTEPIPACAAASLLSAANMDVTPSRSPLGFSSANVSPDSLYASYPSSSVEKPGYVSSTVLLPGLNGACDQIRATRCVLGPAVMSSRSIATATVVHSRNGQWLVDYTTTDSGAAVWDKVANENFHQLLGIEMHGVVYSAPIIQPTQSSFSSFNGKGSISGQLTRSEAQHLAKALTAH